MSDVVVTLPLRFGLDTWVNEGQLPDEPWNGLEYDFYLGGYPPRIEPGERVYVVHNGKLRGYAPLVRIDQTGPYSFSLVRHGGAVAVTVDEYIRGFQGFRYRWWARESERPFPDWMVP